jgi:hypothetical protein
MFLETDSVLRKKNIEEGEQRIIAAINPRN